MLIDFHLGATSIVFRVKVRNSSLATGAGLTGLTNASSGLRIAAIADNEATTTSYTSAGSAIDTITTLGTYAAPTSGHCRFRELDATSHPGVFEVQLDNARYAVSGSKSLLISISGATNAAECDVVIPLRTVNPYDANFGLANLDAAVSTRSTYAGGAVASVTGNVTGSVGSVAAAVTVGTNNDKTGYALTQAFPANFAALGIGSTGKITGVALVDTLTTYTGNTPQTGDNFARIGTNGAGLTSIPYTGPSAGTIQSGLATSAALSTLSTLIGSDFSALTTAVGTPAQASALATLATAVGAPLQASGYTAPPSAATIAAAILVTPSQKIVTDASGFVSTSRTQVLAAPRNLTSVADAAMTVNDAAWGAVAGAAGQQAWTATTGTIKTPAGTTVRTFTVTTGSTSGGRV